MISGWSRSVIWHGLGYCLAALALDWLSTIGLYRGIGVTPWSPATGLALAYTYLAGPQSFPFVVAAELLTLVVVNPQRFSPLNLVLVSLMSASITMAMAIVLRHIDQFDGRLPNVQSLLILIVTATLGALAHMAVYMTAVWADGLLDQPDVFPAAWRLVVGNLVGVLVVSPLAFLISQRVHWPRPTWVHLAQLVVLAIALWTVFAYRQATTYQLFYLLFLPLLWVALRDGVLGSVILLNVAQIGIIAGTQMRADFSPGTGSLQVLMIALAVTGLLVGVIVTEREAAARRLREQQTALGRSLRLRSAGETAAAIAHQINQPITAIATYAAIARDAIAENNSALATTALDKLKAECERTAQVMRSIRDLVRQGALSPSHIQLPRLLESIRTMHATELAAARINLNINVANGITSIFADPIQIEQAIDNLVVNGIEAISETGKPGQISIKVSAADLDTLIDVEDDGPGFQAGLDTLAPTPFMTTKRNGSGLGLAIARSVAEAHGGSLAILKRSSGATIRIRLPTTGKQDGKGNQHH